MNGKDFEFRDARESELYEIVGLLADDILGSQREKYQHPLPVEYLSAFQMMTMQTGNRLIVAVDDGGKIQGCLQLTIVAGLARRGAVRGTIEGVRISSDKRGTGLGRELFKFAINEAKKAGCTLVQLTTDRKRPDAHRFYKALGFEPSHVGMKLNL